MPPPARHKTRPEDARAKTLHEALDELPVSRSSRPTARATRKLASASASTLLEQIVEQLPPVKAPLDDAETRREEVRGLLDFLNAMEADGPARNDGSRST